jgi:hypothetical protein
MRYSVLISHFEIYNDSIYDLLTEVPENQRRVGLRPKEDKHGCVSYSWAWGCWLIP